MTPRAEPLATYLELRESTPEGDEAAGLSHKAGGLVLLHVLELAARGGVTIVHDAGDHGGRYVEAAHALADVRWAVALPDLRGHGKSEGARGHGAGLREVVRDLDAVQAHLAYRLPMAPKVLVGVGLGALYSLAYALEKPGQLAALVLLAPRWEPRFDLPQPSGLFARFKKPDPMQAGRVGNDAEALTSDPAQQAAWRADPLVHDTITRRAAEQALEIAARCRAGAAALDTQALVLHGGDDPVADPALSRALAGPRVEVEILDGARHDLLHERRAAEVLARIATWLDAREP
jgi:alpha-beta hydrolase superfamily lysophospholipase